MFTRRLKCAQPFREKRSLFSLIRTATKHAKPYLILTRRRYPGAVQQGRFNRSFAHSCFCYAIDTKQDLWFSAKDTISKQYDQTFKLIFQEIFENEYKDEFDKLGIEYFYTLIDDAVARVIRSEGGYIWAMQKL